MSTLSSSWYKVVCYITKKKCTCENSGKISANPFCVFRFKGGGVIVTQRLARAGTIPALPEINKNHSL